MADFRPTDILCITIMNGETHLLRLNPRYADGRFRDLTHFLDSDQQLAEKGARNLGATIFKHYKNLKWAELHKLIQELNAILRENAKLGKKTFIYL